jgi:alpha-glucosidase (family GH31 glycosyl hydrolase)
MLGDALLVAPVLEAGATGRQVDLPDDARFFDWFTREPAESGFKDADLQEIPVFAVDGRIIPTLPEAPETLVDWPTGDDARILYVFGAGGTFTEADGTTYEVQGEPTSAAEATASFDSGSIDAGGATVVVTGSRTRSYQVVVTP